MSLKTKGPIALLVISTIGWLVAGDAASAQDRCQNPGGQTFNRAPVFKAPDRTRGRGALLNIQGELRPLPDARASCLPLSLRLNNPGALQTPRAGPWQGQIGRDTKGHAVFATLADGIAAWTTWLRRRTASNPRITSFQMMSIYAPPNDCLGSVAKLPNGQCPPGFPLNPTLEYATRVAAAVGKGPNDPLVLDPTDCRDRRNSLFAVFREIMTFEAGRGFCGNGLCSVEREIFEAAVDRVAGPIDSSRCAGLPGGFAAAAGPAPVALAAGFEALPLDLP